MRERKKRELSTTQVIALGFLLAIVIGTVLLMLPIASASGQWTSPIDALFTATTSICVTGLVVVDTFSYWSIWGQIIILILIQIGGLGIVTLTTSLMVLIGRKVTLKDRLLLEDAFNLNTLSGLVRFMKKILKGTLLVEAIGAICYLFVFVPKFQWRGIWISIFNAISAFCNAGMDVIGQNSLMDYVNNPWVNLITMLLIICGGIGFVVWWDIIRVIDLCKKGVISKGQRWERCNLHTKIVLVTTGVLILVGMIGVFVMEYGNPQTLGSLPLGSKVMASLFQSVTTRTAGFATISQAGLKEGTALLCMLLMFIGGSPVGTAGGIKTTTVALLVMAAAATVKGKENVTAYKRTIPLYTIRKALAVVLISVSVTAVAILILVTLEPGRFVDVLYETISAVGTVGLSRNFTSSMDTLGKIVIIVCMYLGRIGPISMVIAFNFKKGKSVMLEFPKEEVTVG